MTEYSASTGAWTIKDGQFINDETLEAVRAESIRATLKHGFSQTNLNPYLAYVSRLANLMEEVGEVAQLLTYDKMTGDYHEKLYKELIQVANLALAWAQAEQEQMRLKATAVPASQSDIP